MLRATFINFLKKTLTLAAIFGGLHLVLVGFSQLPLLAQGGILGLALSLSGLFIFKLLTSSQTAPAPAMPQPVSSSPQAIPAQPTTTTSSESHAEDFPFNEDILGELTDLLKSVKSEMSGSTATFDRDLDSGTTNSEFDDCAVIVSFDTIHNPKTYVIPNVATNAGIPQANSAQSNQSRHLMRKAMTYMKQQGYRIQTLRPNDIGKPTVEPRYKFSPTDMFSKPIQFPSNIFNLN